MHVRPSLFIGSSSEGLAIAEAFQQTLGHEADVEVWSQGVFAPGAGFLETLLKKLDTADFAVLVLTADDTVESRGQTTGAPRDNVLFELGLFMGRIGRDRVFFVYDQGHRPKLPTDLLGIAGAAFRTQANGNLEASVGSAATAIKRRMTALGRRPQLLRILPTDTQPSASVPDVSGQWHGYTPGRPNPEISNAVMDVEQYGTFIRATIERTGKIGTRIFEYEGRLTSGQLVLFFEDVRGRGFIVGTVILYVSGNLQTLTGRNTYYHHTQKKVISTERIFRRPKPGQ